MSKNKAMPMPMPDSWLHNPRPGAPATIIVEVAQAHDGSLGMAHAYIDCAARCGADAIKFQTHIAEAESTPSEPWRTKFSSQDETRFDYWKRMEFSKSQWSELEAHAREAGLLFLSSPFSAEAIDLLADVGVAGWKVASGETNNHALIAAMAQTGKPVLISTGMSAWPEIEAAVELVRGHQAPVGVFQCTSAYPCPPEKLGLNVIAEIRERLGCAAGLSDHSGTIYAGIAAATVGIEFLELHLTFSREMFGPDVPSSVIPEELAQLVEGIRFAETLRAYPVDKSRVPDDIAGLRSVFMKSVVAKDDLAAGTVLEDRHLTAKKPGAGIPANDLPTLIGRRLQRDVKRNALLSHDDLEAAQS
ncbi:MAG: N-acetylneuraminate synthase family protein [Planctomycetota bacterium]